MFGVDPTNELPLSIVRAGVKDGACLHRRVAGGVQRTHLVMAVDSPQPTARALADRDRRLIERILRVC